MERARTLSNKANKFDAKRLVGAKPEIKYRLTLVKKDNSLDSESGKTDENGKFENNKLFGCVNLP